MTRDTGALTSILPTVSVTTPNDVANLGTGIAPALLRLPDLRSAITSAYFWLAGALFIGLLLRVHCLLHPYLWLDEYVTLWSIGGSTYGQMLQRAHEWTASGPLFVLTYRLSCDLLGNVDSGLKFPSVLAGTAAIWVTWWVARRLFAR